MATTRWRRWPRARVGGAAVLAALMLIGGAIAGATDTIENMGSPTTAWW